MHGDVESLGKMYLVISHCDKPLHWLNEYIEGHQFETITISSKCRNDVEGAPDGAIVETLENIGPCDHTYAKWMSTCLGQHSKICTIPYYSFKIIIIEAKLGPFERLTTCDGEFGFVL